MSCHGFVCALFYGKIKNQPKKQEEYAKRQGFSNIRHFTDDGISDTTFEREGFQKLIAEVEAGNVATVIVKDMGRLGRNYLKVGFYADIMFPEKGVDVSAIARQLTDEHVLIPSAHAAEQTIPPTEQKKEKSKTHDVSL